MKEYEKFLKELAKLESKYGMWITSNGKINLGDGDKKDFNDIESDLREVEEEGRLIGDNTLVFIIDTYKEKQTMKRLLYVVYRIKFFFEHLEYGMRGQSPVCYNEWLDNEYEYYLEMKGNK